MLAASFIWDLVIASSQQAMKDKCMFKAPQMIKCNTKNYGFD
jgi:hypothetical protein